MAAERTASQVKIRGVIGSFALKVGVKPATGAFKNGKSLAFRMLIIQYFGEMFLPVKPKSDERFTVTGHGDASEG